MTLWNAVLYDANRPPFGFQTAITMLSIPHMIVVFVIVLVVFGPAKASGTGPQPRKAHGRVSQSFHTTSNQPSKNEMRDLERQAAEVERKKRREVNAAATQLSPDG